ncbi:MAG: tRNA (adenosine(37)-N6)-dimethylallyltransferase MiaA [Candidatus Omnitrophica bacterium]|nr:tRNA (adenosine(37)-N6)-dimethylallyltransferase MiaA [Candidatus Omnitrophota bacterium]
MLKKPLVIFLIGPTASGKSEVAVELACLINAEIISADSMQVYRGMDILNAKPSAALRSRAVHHLIDCLELDEEYSAALFREKALKLIPEIHSRNHIPLIAGGTGLYVRVLTKGLFEDKGKDKQLRVKLQKLAEEKGNDYLYERLQKVDPEAAKKIHPNNLRRVIRSLEAYELNKKPISQLKTQISGLDASYRVMMFGLERERGELYQRIEGRVDAMLRQGALEEARRLKVMKLSKTACQVLGIKQLFAYIDGDCSFAEAVEILKRDTRRFAKRQLTWFRQDKDIVWIRTRKEDQPKEIACQICVHLSAKNK